MSGIAKTIFRLNGQFLALGEALAGPVGLTAARWQVLGAVLDQPLPVAEVARKIGVTRQSVQRVADILVMDELAEYGPNPAHRRAKLLLPTERGRATARRIGPAHATLAERLTKEVDAEGLRRTLDDLARLSDALERTHAQNSLEASTNS